MPPLKKNVTCAYFPVSAVRNCRKSRADRYSPRLLCSDCGANATGRPSFGRTGSCRRSARALGPAAIRCVELFFGQGAADFTGAIGAEIPEHHRIAVLDGGDGASVFGEARSAG